MNLAVGLEAVHHLLDIVDDALRTLATCRAVVVHNRRVLAVLICILGKICSINQSLSFNPSAFLLLSVVDYAIRSWFTHIFPVACSIFSTTGLSSLSPSSREPVDPIAELLSQLSGVRRSASNATSSTSSQLQQLQMHLQLERQQVSARQQLERLPRRQNQSQTTSLREAASSANTNFGYSLLMNPNTTAAQPTASAPPVPSPPSNFLLEGLLEELSLQSSNDANFSDRYNFADNLLVGTMNSMKNSVQQSQIGEDLSAQIQQRYAATVTPTPNVELSSASGSRPTSAQGRVLRGRARSDGHNAIRRADANRASLQDCKKTESPPNNTDGSGGGGGITQR